ncbi:MAG: hypothetical protein EBW42_11625, partial [Rhodobacterales bacterium]|nr:hypothetical protein [Rhodobacterales bacterium]
MLVVTEVDRVVLYDADDSDLSMWMIFNTVDIDSSSGNYNVLGHTGREATKGTAMNGEFLFCSKNNQNQTYINFITEQSLLIYQTIDIYKGNISQRNNNAHYIGYMDIPGGRFAQNHAIVDRNVHDVAMTVLPNARIDQNTGLPVPTIAVATDGGVSVIKDDGTVVDLNVYDRPYSSVYFSGNVVWAVENPETDYDLLRYFEIPTSDITAASSYGPNSSPALFPENTKGNIFDSFNYGSPIGITKLDHEGSMVAYTTSKYNTGWMPGDIKLATLSDTTVETIGESSDELVVDGDGNWVGDFNVASDLDSWTKTGDVAGITITGGKLRIERTTALTYATYAMSVVEGVVYQVSADIQLVSGGGSPGLRLSKVEMDVGSSLVAGDLYQSDNTRKFRADYTGLLYISVYHQNEPGVSDFGNISVRATTELITNGDFSIDTSGWVGEDASLTNANHPDSGSNSLLVTPTALPAPGRAKQDLTTVSGQRYVLSASIAFGAGCTKISIADNSGNFINEDYFPGDGNRTITIYFNGDVGLSELILLAYGGPAYFDNISVRPAEEDRSVNGNGLQIVGEINKTPVAPGADLVA